MLRVQELGHVSCGFLTILPRHSVGGRAMEAGVGREQPIRDPAVVDLRRRVALEPADVVGRESETRQGEAQSASECFGHRLEGGLAVASPVLRMR